MGGSLSPFRQFMFIKADVMQISRFVTVNQGATRQPSNPLPSTPTNAIQYPLTAHGETGDVSEDLLIQKIRILWQWWALWGQRAICRATDDTERRNLLCPVSPCPPIADTRKWPRPEPSATRILNSLKLRTLDYQAYLNQHKYFRYSTPIQMVTLTLIQNNLF